MADFPTYQQIVNQFETACNEHLAIHEFGEGSIDRLDSLVQNVKYTFAFLRPLQSTGMVLNQNGVSGARSLNFEFYMIQHDKRNLYSEIRLHIRDFEKYRHAN